MVFKSKIHTSAFIILIIFPILLGFGLYENSSEGIMISFIILALIFGILFISIKTKFIINQESLICDMLIYKKTISIKEIRKVQENHNLIKSCLLKFGCSYKGYYIVFNKYDEVFVSPENSTIFISELLKINPKIEINKIEK